MHVHAHAGTRVGLHEATSLTGLVPERVQLTVHTTEAEPTGTVPEPFHCDHIARWSARTGTSGRSGRQIRNHLVAPLHTCPFFNIVILVEIWHAIHV